MCNKNVPKRPHVCSNMNESYETSGLCFRIVTEKHTKIIIAYAFTDLLKDFSLLLVT